MEQKIYARLYFRARPDKVGPRLIDLGLVAERCLVYFDLTMFCSPINNSEKITSAISSVQELGNSPVVVRIKAPTLITTTFPGLT